MREIKFRMVTQATGKFLGYVGIYELLRNGSDVLPDFEEAALEGVKFEQYTGLNDRNGKEIYEGDIVRSMEIYKGGATYEVAWFEKDGGWFCFSNDDDRYEPLYHTDFEVIGNIHENIRR